MTFELLSGLFCFAGFAAYWASTLDWTPEMAETKGHDAHLAAVANGMWHE